MAFVWQPALRDRLQAFLRDHAILPAIDRIDPIGEGHSNLTFRVACDGHAVVVRRPPPPPMPPGAHDVLREARLLRALAGSAVPVAPVLATGEAGAVFDVPFYVMAFVPGVIVTSDLPDPLTTPDACLSMGLAMAATLAALHRFDWQAAGLGDFGRPEGYNSRHVQRIARLVRVDDALDPRFAAGLDWLLAQVPPEFGASVIHNDFRLGNLMWSPALPVRLAAVLDWELATLGDPLSDLAYLVDSFPQRGVAPTPTQALATATLDAGFPEPEALITHYAACIGRAVPSLAWYRVLNAWKLAAMYDYSRRRGLDPYFQQPGQVERFLAAAASAMHGD